VSEAGRGFLAVEADTEHGPLRVAVTQILLGPPGSDLGTPGYEAADRGDAARRSR
jgi:hypothetical protein